MYSNRRFSGKNVLDQQSMFLFIFQGKVKVVRVQNVINTEQDNKLLRGSTEDLGCAKASSHADGMNMFLVPSVSPNVLFGH